MKEEAKRKKPRIKDFSLAAVKFIPVQSSFEMAVINLSTSGIALLQGAPEIKVMKDDLLSGNLYIEDEKIPVVLTVIRVNNDFIGCRFERGIELIDHCLKNKFSIELIALQLTGVKPGILEKQKDGQPHWYFDGNACELYFVEDNNFIKRYRLTFQNHHLEGGEDRKPEYTGHDFNKKMNHDIAQKLIRFIENIDGLVNDYKDYFQNEIRRLEF